TRWPRDWSSDVCSSDLCCELRLAAHHFLSLLTDAPPDRIDLVESARGLPLLPSHDISPETPPSLTAPHGEAREGYRLISTAGRQIGRASWREREELTVG